MSATRFFVALVCALAILPAAAHAATITVSTTADSGPGSLRAAVAGATSGDTVVVPAGEYRLETQVTVDKTLTIRGAGARATVLDGQDATRVLLLDDPAAYVTLEGMRITHGKIGDFGGGIRSDVPFTIRDSAIVDNEAANGGGGIYARDALTMERTLVAANRIPPNAFSTRGAGMVFQAPDTTHTVTSSTITANSGAGWGGGLFVFGVGAQTVRVINSTIDGNSATSGGANVNAQATAFVRLRNTWLGHGNLELGGAEINCAEDNADHIISEGNNAQDIFDDNCNFKPSSDDKAGVDAKLTPLQDNGGPTDTLAPQAGSALLGMGKLATCATHDQRGVPRPQGGTCEVGAVERTTPTIGAAAAEAVAHSSAVITAPVDPIGLPGVARVDYGVSSALGLSAQTAVSGSGVAGVALGGLAPSTLYHYRVTFTTADGSVNTANATFTTATAPAPAQTPAPTPTKTTTRCTVPRLKGMTLVGAKKTLARGRCKLGTVRRPKGAAGRGRLVVRSQSPAAGRKVAAGTKVALTLGRKPAPSTKR